MSQIFSIFISGHLSALNQINKNPIYCVLHIRHSRSQCFAGDIRKKPLDALPDVLVVQVADFEFGFNARTFYESFRQSVQ